MQMTMPPKPTIFGEGVAAEMLGLSVRTLQRWRIEGKGPKFVMLGRRIGYTEDSVRDYIAGLALHQRTIGRRPKAAPEAVSA